MRVPLTPGNPFASGRSSPCSPRPSARRSYHGNHPAIANRNGRSAGRSTPLDLASQHTLMERENNGFPCISDRYCHLFFPAPQFHRMHDQGRLARYIEVRAASLGFLGAELPKSDVTDSYRAQCDQGASLPVSKSRIGWRPSIGEAALSLVPLQSHRTRMCIWNIWSMSPHSQLSARSPAAPCSSTLACAPEPWLARNQQRC